MDKCRFEFIRTKCGIWQRICLAKSALTGCALFCGFGFNLAILASGWVWRPIEFEPTVFGAGDFR